MEPEGSNGMLVRQLPVGLDVPGTRTKIAHLAVAEDLTLREAALRSGVREETYDQVVVPRRLTGPGSAS